MGEEMAGPAAEGPGRGRGWRERRPGPWSGLRRSGAGDCQEEGPGKVRLEAWGPGMGGWGYTVRRQMWRKGHGVWGAGPAGIRPTAVESVQDEGRPLGRGVGH